MTAQQLPRVGRSLAACIPRRAGRAGAASRRASRHVKGSHEREASGTPADAAQKRGSAQWRDGAELDEYSEHVGHGPALDDAEVVARIAGPRVDAPVKPIGALKLKSLDERVAAARIVWGEDDGAAVEESPARAITAVIVDDERLLRTGFRVMLETEPDITVIGEAGDGRAALDVVRRRKPDVV